jgi:coatomer subunit beta'
MDNSGKIIWSKQNEIQTANVKTGDDAQLADGEKIVLPVKDLGQCEIYPQTLSHSPNGRFVVVCGDGEFIIYTALAWRNKSFGKALEFVWAQDSNEYAIRESTSRVRLFKSFKEKNTLIRFGYSAEGIYGGNLLAIRSSSFLIFYDWESGMVVRRVDVTARNVIWSESDIVCIAGEESFYILRFNRAVFMAAVEAGTADDEGVEEAFEFITEINEHVNNGSWVGDCFIYTTSSNRVNYLVGTQVSTVSHFDQSVYLLGYLSHNNRIFVCDKNMVTYL